jgi:hypothetical protein
VPTDQDAAGAKGNGRPQPFDPAKVRVAVARAKQLALAVAADRTGEEYRRVLGPMMDEVFEGDLTQQQVADRVAYLLYGSAMFASGTLTLLTELANVSRDRALEILDSAIDEWLANPQ